jgi:hypothetical protein
MTVGFNIFSIFVMLTTLLIWFDYLLKHKLNFKYGLQSQNDLCCEALKNDTSKARVKERILLQFHEARNIKVKFRLLKQCIV